MNPRNNISRFKVGTVFIGLVNHHKMEVLEITQTPMTSGNRRSYLGNKKAVVKDHTTGQIFKTPLAHLAYCNLKIM